MCIPSELEDVVVDVAGECGHVGGALLGADASAVVGAGTVVLSETEELVSDVLVVEADLFA